MKRNTDELINNFVEQVLFLRKSCADYDNGEIVEIKRISVSLRNLLKDKGRDVSALTHLQKKDTIPFWDSSSKTGGMSNFIIDNMQNCTVMVMNIYMGLVIKKISGIDNELKYQFVPLFHQPNWQRQDKLKFHDWYTQIIYADPTGSSLTRENLILSIAEQDGGNHFDLKINNHYYQFKQKDSLKLNVNGRVVIFENNPAFVSLRQIANEVLEGLNHDADLKTYLQSHKCKL